MATNTKRTQARKSPTAGRNNPQTKASKKKAPQKTAERRATTTRAPEGRGISLGYALYGKFLFRIREHHVANHLVPLMRQRRVGAAKLDLVLRCVALQKKDAGARETGFVLSGYSWERLYDLCREPGGIGADAADLDASSSTRKVKRKWTGEQLGFLEQLNLITRTKRPGRRSGIVVLRDDGSGAELDDPDGNGPGNSYITVLGSVIATGQLASWGTPELSAYLAAMAAERLDPGAGNNSGPGTGRWFRSLAWFADKDGLYGPPNRTRLPFAVSTLERGFKGLRSRRLITHDHILIAPHSRQILQGRRNHYANHFASLNDKVRIVTAAEYAAEVQAASDDDN